MKFHPIRFVLFSFAGLCLASLATFAQEQPGAGGRPASTERPPFEPGPGSTEGRGRVRPEWRRDWRPGDGYRGGGGGGDAGQNDDISVEKWAEVENFMKTHSPERIKRLEEVPEDRRDNLKRFIARRYENLQTTRDREPAVYEIRLKRLQVEDEMFALKWQLRETEKSESVSEISGKLRQQLKALVENGLQERRLRMAQAEERVRSLRADLKQEENDVEATVDRLLKGLVDEDRWPVLGEPAMANQRPPGGAMGPGSGGRFRGSGDGRFAAPSTQPAE